MSQRLTNGAPLQWPNEKPGPSYGIEHDFPFDPTYGYTKAELLAVGAPSREPERFEAFWVNLYERTLDTELKLERLPSRIKAGDDWLVEELKFDTLDGFRVGAWLVTPKKSPIKKLIVHGHGYGGRGGPGPDFVSEAANLYPCAPGFHLSASPDLPHNDCNRHVLHGIESRHTYIFRNCAAAWWSSATALIHLFPEQANDLRYYGWSYGGGMGALMLPWDQRFRCAELGQVSFCHHPFRVLCDNHGSGEAVNRHYSKYPHIMDVLDYFDAAYSCKRLKIPTVVAASLFDPYVCPPGQFCAFNVMPGPKWLSVFPTGHYHQPHPDDDKALRRHRNNMKKLEPPKTMLSFIGG